MADGRHLRVAEHHARDAAVVGRDGAARGCRRRRCAPGRTATCVNGATPVTSPTAQTPSAARRWSSTTTAPWSVRTPAASRPRPSTRGRRPVATSSTAAPTVPPSSKRTSTPAPSRRTATAWPAAPSRMATPSSSSARRTCLRASSSSRGSGQGPGSVSVTSLPKRASICASSVPTGPEPSTTTLGGTSRRRRRLAVRPEGDVGQPVDGRERGRRPGRDDDPLGPQSAVAEPRTRDRARSSRRPGPRTTSMPWCSSLRVFFVSSRPEVMYSR